METSRGCEYGQQREIQQETRVSIETVRRDLRDLSDAGFRVREATEYRRAKRWREEGFDDGFTFSIMDLLSISMGRQFQETLTGTPFTDVNTNPILRLRVRHSDHVHR